MNLVTYKPIASTDPPACGPTEPGGTSDVDLILALDASPLEDLAEIGRILARYELSLEANTDPSSQGRCAAFLREAAHLGLIDDGQGLSLREYVSAPLCLPDYLKALVSAVGTRIGREGATSLEPQTVPSRMPQPAPHHS